MADAGANELNALPKVTLIIAAASCPARTLLYALDEGFVRVPGFKARAVDPCGRKLCTAVALVKTILLVHPSVSPDGKAVAKLALRKDAGLVPEGLAPHAP